MADKAADLQHQDRTYRRGLVLGLTMAEIMVLILFALLLALADSINNRNSRIADLQRQLQAAQELIGELGAGVSVSDIIQRLERQKQKLEKMQAALARMPELEAKAAALDQLLAMVEAGDKRAPDRESVLGALKEGMAAVRENENLRGQNAQLSEQIKRSGRGNEFPSCWATLEGKPESIFEVTLRPTGLVVHDRALAHRADDQRLLPLGGITYDVELSREEFANQLRPLYRWSVEKNCRFYTIRYTATKAVESDLMNALDGYFYPDSLLVYRP